MTLYNNGVDTITKNIKYIINKICYNYYLYIKNIIYLLLQFAEDIETNKYKF